MMTEGSRDRDAWLERALTDTGEDSRTHERLAADEALREELLNLRDLQRRLDREGALEREILSRVAPPVTTPKRRPALWLGAAVILLGLLFWIWRFDGFAKPIDRQNSREDVQLGAGDAEILDPIRDDSGNLIVRWEAKDGHRYDVRLWPESAEPAFDDPVFTRESVTAGELVVPSELVPALSSSMRIQIVEHGSALTHLLSRTCQVPASR